MKKQELQELKELSLKLFGVSSRWEKLQKKTRVFSHYKETEVGFKKLRVEVTRQPTVSEILHSLRYMADVHDYETGTPESIVKKAAKEFVEKKLNVALALHVEEGKEQEYQELRSKVNTEYHQWLDRMVEESKHGSTSGKVNINALDFLRKILEEEE